MKSQDIKGTFAIGAPILITDMFTLSQSFKQICMWQIVLII